jgi:hypothetical protein
MFSNEQPASTSTFVTTLLATAALTFATVSPHPPSPDVTADVSVESVAGSVPPIPLEVPDGTVPRCVDGFAPDDELLPQPIKVTALKASRTDRKGGRVIVPM